MRPNQNNKNRSRGRNNNGGRKHINPLSRNFESNGPDVKVRGNAAHVAEKYLQLARDAQSSGDSVMAENYLQHAEHYFRIVAAAQPQQNGREFGQPAETEDFDDDFPPMNDRFASPEPRQPFPQQPQPSDASSQPAMADADNGETVVIQAVPVEGNEAAPAQGEGAEGRRHRDRRPRRRSRGNTEGGANNEGADPGNAPQPDIGLPAFLTAGGSAAE
jgi:hypothetical protein